VNLSLHSPFGNLLADVAVSQANIYRLPKEYGTCALSRLLIHKLISLLNSGETVDLYFQFVSSTKTRGSRFSHDVCAHQLNEGPFPPRPLENANDVNLTLNACAWIVLQDVDTPIEAESARDAWLAVAGADCVIHVLSIALCREIFQLFGHTDDIVALETCSGARELLLSLSAKGVVRVWNVVSRSCIAEYTTDATCIAVAPSGSMFYTGHANGAVRSWLMPLAVAVDTQMFNETSAMATVQLKRRIVALRTARNAVIALDRRPTLSVLVDAAYDSGVDSGTPVVARAVHHEWSVPQTNEQCGIDVSPDGLRVLLGDQAGDLSLFDIASGQRVGLKKAQSRLIALKRALWSLDCRDVVCVGDAPFVWRWKFMHPDERRELTEEYTQTIAMREIEAQVRAEQRNESKPAATASTTSTAATTSTASTNDTHGSVLPAVKRSKKRLH
jgi:hypothetical protein